MTETPDLDLRAAMRDPFAIVPQTLTPSDLTNTRSRCPLRRSCLRRPGAHTRPAHDWTVAELARAVATSKTVLIDRFNLLLGRPPIHYLTEWRLNLASGLLRTTESGVAEIAGRVGYTSEEAFNRAFKRALGKSPAHWRVEPDGTAEAELK